MSAKARRPQPPQPESWRKRSLEERARGIESACRTALQLLAAVPDRDARLARIDPVPASTRALLRRLAARRTDA
jgi:hypothetical protein